MENKNDDLIYCTQNINIYGVDYNLTLKYFWLKSTMYTRDETGTLEQINIEGEKQEIQQYIIPQQNYNRISYNDI